MKRIFIILLQISLSINTLACSCSILSTITSEYQTSDFVGVVKIIKNHKNYPDTNEYYKADVEVLNLYKGKTIKSLHVLGNNGGKSYNSCGTFIGEGEIRLVFGKINKETLMTTSLCTSYYKPLNPNYKRDQIEEKLNILKRFARKHTITIYNEAAIYTSDFLRTSNLASINYFSIVGVTLSEEGKPKKIFFLTKDEKALKTKIIHYFNRIYGWKRLTRIREINKGELTVFFEINPYKP